MTFGVKIPTLHACSTSMYDMIWCEVFWIFYPETAWMEKCRNWNGLSVKCFCVHIWYRSVVLRS